SKLLNCFYRDRGHLDRRPKHDVKLLIFMPFFVQNVLMTLKAARNKRQTRRKKGEFGMAIFMNEIDENKDFLLKLDLQFFAQDDNPGADKPGHDVHDDDNGGVNPGAEPEPYAGEGDDKTNKKPNKKEKLFTQEEVNRIVKERLARALKDKEEAIKEAEKLAKMNAEQKREYELEKLRRENEQLKKAQLRYELGREATK